jgi:hypothetical protein
LAQAASRFSSFLEKPSDKRVKPCYRIAGWPPILSISLTSGKKNPAKPRPAAVASGPLAVSLLRRK